MNKIDLNHLNQQDNDQQAEDKAAAADLNNTVTAFLIHQYKKYLINIIHNLAAPIARPEATAEEISIYSSARIMSAVCNALEVELKGRGS